MTRNLLLSFAFITVFSIPLSACSNDPKESGIPALFETKEEAQKAAKDFGCTGAHKMGDKWMPCEKHEDHEKLDSHGDHGHHQNH